MARQDQGPLRQPGHGLHQGCRRSARPGGTCHQHGISRRLGKPAFHQLFHQPPLPPFAVGGGLVRQKACDDLHELFGARPMRRMIRDIQVCNRLGRDSFALHLIHQGSEAIGQIKQGAARGNIRGEPHQTLDHLRQQQAPPQGGYGGRDARKRKVAAQIGDQPQPRQQPRTESAKRLDHAAAHPVGVDVKRDAGHRLGRGVAKPRLEARGQRFRKIHTGGQAKNPRGAGAKHPAPSALFRPW